MSTEPSQRPIEDCCYWLSQRVLPEEPPLEGTRKADVVVIGAGLTGLWTAIHLLTLRPSLGVIVLDKGCVAYGASGRNAGMLSDTIDHTHGLAIEHFGLLEAAKLAKLGRTNIEEMTQFLAAKRIQCDLERTGILTTALSDQHVEGLLASLESARAVGVTDWKLLSMEETRAQIKSDRYHGALLNPGGGVLDPVKLTEGLASEARRMGATTYDRSPVISVQGGDGGVVVKTKGGEVRATTCVLATSAYTHQLLPEVSFRFLPLYDYVIASEPLTPAQKEAIGWRGREGVNDMRSFFNYYRLTADDRIIWGTSEAEYYPKNRVDLDCDHSERHYAELRESFVSHFPALAGLAFPYAWGGAICATTRFTPFFGRAQGGSVLYGLGFTGHGLGTTHLAGKLLAHMALHRHTPLLDLRMVREAPFPYPPEPIRAWAVGRVTSDLRRVDAGEAPSVLLRTLEALGIGLSS